jgi:hypothetical protein
VLPATARTPATETLADYFATQIAGVALAHEILARPRRIGADDGSAAVLGSRRIGHRSAIAAERSGIGETLEFGSGDALFAFATPDLDDSDFSRVDSVVDEIGRNLEEFGRGGYGVPPS